MRVITSHYGSRHGVVIVYMALTLPVLIGVFGLAADTAYVYWTAAQLQTAADAAALAGAQEVAVNSSTAISNAVSIAAANRAGGAAVQLNVSTDVVIGNYNSTTNTFSANATPYNAVQVTARRNQGSLAGPLNLIFGPIYGIKTANVSRSAIAMVNTGTNNGLLVLSPSGTSILFSGTSSITVTNGNVVVDSTSSASVLGSGSPTITASGLNLSGGMLDVTYSGGTEKTGCAATADPLASLVSPAKPSAASGGAPGYYGSGINLSSGTLTLTGGIYYIDGGITLGGSASINASAGCLIYLNSGGITMSGSSSITYAPMSTGTYAGISIFEARTNSSSIALSGTSSTNNTGVVYAPHGEFVFSGSSKSIGSQLICNTLGFSGNGAINIDAGTASGSGTPYLVQ